MSDEVYTSHITTAQLTSLASRHCNASPYTAASSAGS
jgi:hypothetical protein